jgi:transcriptional antiterminator NusG
MTTGSSLSGPRWYAVQTLSNQEAKVKKYLDKFVEIEDMGDCIFEVLMPTEIVTEFKNGKKIQKTRKFYPGYVFVHMNLFDEDGQILQKPWYFVRSTQGIIGFVGGERPVPLKKDEIERILGQVKDAEGRETPKVQFEVGEDVKITDGPFLNLTGRIDEIDPERGRLKVSVSIFGRFTPVELEYWQVELVQE